jgi:hypothetical protein
MRTQVEIECLRRILFAIGKTDLEMLRTHFVKGLEEEVALDDLNQQAVDYLDWLIRRREIL